MSIFWDLNWIFFSNTGYSLLIPGQKELNVPLFQPKKTFIATTVHQSQILQAALFYLFVLSRHGRFGARPGQGIHSNCCK